MGKGDKKSKKGKISMGSFGNSRSSKTTKSIEKPITKVMETASSETAKPKKTVVKKKPAKKED